MQPQNTILKLIPDGWMYLQAIKLCIVLFWFWIHGSKWDQVLFRSGELVFFMTLKNQIKSKIQKYTVHWKAHAEENIYTVPQNDLKAELCRTVFVKS